MLTDRPLSEVLDQVAARSSAPGGGSSAAWTCGLGAGLVAMAAAFTIDCPGFEDRRERMTRVHEAAERLRAEAVGLAERELHAYAPVLEVLRLPQDAPTRAEQMHEALGRASEALLETAHVGAQVAELAVEVASDGNDHVRGDALAGALLAEAGCRAAGCLVQINLRAVPDDPRLEALETFLLRAAAARRSGLA